MTKLKPWQQTTLSIVGIVVICFAVYAFFEAKAILALTSTGLAILLLWYIDQNRTR